MTLRRFMLPGAALVAVLAVLGMQFAFGGGDFVPSAAADPCVERPLGPVTTDLDQVTQAVVVGGVQDAACALGTSRESLLLALPNATDRAALAQQTGKTEDEILAAVKAGMLASVDRLDQGGRIPPASGLVDAYASELGLSGLALQAVKSVPPEMIDRLLPTGAVVRRAIEGLDLAELLSDADGPDAWEPALRSAIRDAAIAEVKEQILDQLPSSLSSVFGG
ncbi:MAG: hypothetical protein JHD16_01725 [Solirubrobacteraceae bacterium]|nr:hypothetical protein [Solirubrobacteraceae bacterium]